MGKEGNGSGVVSWFVGGWDLLEPLRNPDFVRLWLATGLWWQGIWIEQMVLGWLALEMTDSPWLVALLGFFRTSPFFLLGLFNSAITDRFRRRKLIAFLQGMNLAGVATVALLLWGGYLEYWHLAAVSLVSGSGWALDWPTRRALVPDLVGKERVVDAMMLDNFLQSLTRISGPLMAGSLLALLGNLNSLLILLCLGLVALLLLLRLRNDSRAPSIRGEVGRAVGRILEGLRYVRHRAPIFGVLLITVVMNVWAFPFLNLLPVFARDVLQQGPVGLGLLGAAHGTGSFVGLLLLSRARRRWSNEFLFTFGSLICCLGLVAFAGSRHLELSLAFLFMSGLGVSAFSIMQSAIILVEAADEMRGRAMGTLVLAIGIGPLGRLQSGGMAEWWGAPFAVGGMALFAALLTLMTGLLLKGFVAKSRKVGG